MKRQPKVAVVIPTKSNLECFFNCLNTFRTQSTYNNVKFYIADTGSTDTELKALKTRLLDQFHEDKNCELLLYDYWNFARINNDVIKNHVDKDTDLILFCNDDIELVNDALSYMVKAYMLHRDIAGTVGCRLIFDNNLVQHAGMLAFARKFENNTISPVSVTHRGYKTQLKFENDGPEEVLGNTCGFCLMSYDLFLEIDGFNENYMYCFEDVELNIECLARGKRNLYLDYAECIHYESASRNRFFDTDQEAVRQQFDYNKSLGPCITKNMDHIKKFVEVIQEELV